VINTVKTFAQVLGTEYMLLVCSLYYK